MISRRGVAASLMSPPALAAADSLFAAAGFPDTGLSDALELAVPDMARRPQSRQVQSSSR